MRAHLMASRFPIHEVRIALTVNDYDQATRFYRDGLGLPVLQEWNTPEGCGMVLALGPQVTLEVIDQRQAALIDQLEVGGRVSGPVRLAFEVNDAGAAAELFERAGAHVFSQPSQMPWGHLNVRVTTPDGMQITLFQLGQEDRAES